MGENSTMSERDLKQMYRTQTVGDFPGSVEVLGRAYTKVEDLRYGTNPHQPAAFYRPVDDKGLVLGHHQILKSGKNGLSQTNMEDMHHAVGILKFMDRSACAVMKHCNPSGVAIAQEGMSLRDVYLRARDADARAAFGSVVVFNKKVDGDTADAIMQSVVETVAAPGFDDGALAVLHNVDEYKRNREIRIVQLPDFSPLPKYIEDDRGNLEIKVFDDGSLVLAKPYLTRMKGISDFLPANNDHKKKGSIEIGRQPTDQEADDLLFAWYVNLHVRSNGVVIVKNGQTLAIGTGEQDRVGAVDQAIHKAAEKYEGTETLKGAVLASDGFFPFRDAIDSVVAAGITAIVQPGGSVSDYDIIAASNESDTAMVFTGERCFSHH
jgi:phosphoribosylaminoimidazolecarboxamide formyltransferase/IMP cyclohydrolase